VVSRELEGVMAKNMDSPYLPGKRARHWLKIKTCDSATCRVIGYTPGRGAREKHFGALVVATKVGRKWIYRGKVGTGFTDWELASLRPSLEALQTDAPPFLLYDSDDRIQWVRPKLKCEVAFQEQTSRGHFRAPVFKGWVK
jgi:ATP-dependent DNA ligase